MYAINGLRIDVEGVDGVGKSTLITQLAELLRNRLGSDRVVTTTEIGVHGDEQLHSQLRQLVKGTDHPLEWTAREAVALACRLANAERYSQLFTGRPGVLLSDRGHYSHTVYATQMAPTELRPLMQHMFGEYPLRNTHPAAFPHIVVHVTCDTTTVTERLRAGGRIPDAIELRGAELQERCAAQFGQLLGTTNSTQPVYHVDTGLQSPEQVTDTLRLLVDAVHSRLGELAIIECR